MNIEDIESNIENSIDELPMYYEVGWDYLKDEPLIENNEFVIVEGNEAIKVWIYKAIKTVRYQYPIYSWDYGCEISSLIGQKYTKGLTKSEAERYIKEAILINPYITDVKIIDINFSEDILSVSIQVDTIYGEVNVNV
ncbi:MAG: DUF2634 domain-containing protein [Peptostreptococcaceae bacterium]|nr:DUF2634 domain-containing protein [Peptostreptococcaceae bacterium]